MRARLSTLICLAGLLAATGARAFPWYASGDNVWGAGLMTPAERGQYVKRIQGMKSGEECRAYLEAHRQEIRARAQARGVALPPPPDTSPCDVMERMGRFSGNAPACPTDTAPAP
ncbi:MAG: hypothetical protein MUC79_11620 [Thiobacillaceae bacterium]|jgi:hypothetical protein|nr:hypothetical protein [Thiobacillaceae bacterium]